jgi:hypothetical protein
MFPQSSPRRDAIYADSKSPKPTGFTRKRNEIMRFTRLEDAVKIMKGEYGLGARLERIQHLWIELRASKRHSREYEELSARIRQEADAFIAAMRTHDTRS